MTPNQILLRASLKLGLTHPQGRVTSLHTTGQENLPKSNTPKLIHEFTKSKHET